MTTAKQQSRAGVWLLAARPKTLWASVAPVVVGGALAWRDGLFHAPSVIVALFGAIFIQIGTNFANDLFDFQRGADTDARTGPLRVTQAGLVSPSQIRMAMILAFAAAFAVGVYLVWRGGWPIVGIGIASIIAAVLYTGGPLPYGYRGLGDIFVFIFFGPVAVVGTFYVQALTTTPLAWLASLPIGFLATAILVVNNLRDIETDRIAGKRTLAVRLGAQASAWEYTLLLLVALAIPFVAWLTDLSSAGVLIASGVMCFGIPLVMTVFRPERGAALNATL
jgi:1,4-dihydroxy-2-naphthoate octaprenyltransferase